MNWFKLSETKIPEWVLPVAGVVAATAVLAWLFWLWRSLSHWRLCRRILGEAPTLNRTTKQLGRMLREIPSRDRQLQPWPVKGGDSTNARYELKRKLLRILHHFGYVGVIVVVDRVDEEALTIHATRKNGFLGGTSKITVRIEGPDGIPNSATHCASESSGGLLNRDKANVAEFIQKFWMRMT